MLRVPMAKSAKILDNVIVEPILKASHVITAKTHSLAFLHAIPAFAMRKVQMDLIAMLVVFALARRMWLERNVKNVALATKDIQLVTNVMTHILGTLFAKVISKMIQVLNSQHFYKVTFRMWLQSIWIYKSKL